MNVTQRVPPERGSGPVLSPRIGAEDNPASYSPRGQQPNAELPRPTHRVLLATESLSNGGAERQLVLLATNLPPEWLVEVWSLTPGVWAEPLLQAGISVIASARKWRFDIRPAFALWRCLLRSKPDVVLTNGWIASLAAGPACAVLRIPLVDSRIRGALILRHNRHKAKLGLRFSDIVVANSQAGLSAWHLHSNKGRVIPNGFDWSRVVPREREIFSRRPLRIIMAARMQAMKHWDLFLEMARIVGERTAGSCTFMAVGDGPERSRLLEKGGALIGSNLLEFIPETKDVMSLLSTADVGVLLTNPHLLAEGCSNSILEYMAAGLPVICSDSGGNAELVEDGVTGFVVPGEDAEHLAEKLLFLAEHPELARQMGGSGARRVREEFSVGLLVQRTLEAFQAAVKRKRRGQSRSDRVE